jgi:hypothetical protein
LTNRLIRISLAAAVLLFGTVAALGQAVNGGFENGNFTGWTLSGDTSLVGVCGASTCPGNLAPENGSYAAFLGPVETATLAQTLPTTPGDQYTVSFFLADPQGGTPDYFSVAFGNASVTLDNFGGSFGWQEYELTTTANSAETQLSFNMRNNPGFWFIDNVTLQQGGSVPEPGTLVLFASGLLGIAGVTRRKLLP